MAENKFYHEIILRGKDYIQKLQGRITVCGAGALGSNLVDSLIRQGFNSIRVIDMDRIETHNIGTQIWSMRDIGRMKTAALVDKVYCASEAEIDAVDKELTSANAKKYLKDSVLVVDCFDNQQSRKLVQDYCRANRIPLIHGGLFADFGQVTYDEFYKVPSDQVEGDVCDYPLARNIILLTVVVMAEEILDFFLSSKPRKKNWTITLKDLRINELKLLPT
jgi:molybdopterin/thiamine biosynthesis adenylyltransferase